MSMRSLVVVPILAILALSGCAGPQELPPVEDKSVGVEAAGAADREGAEGRALPEEELLAKKRVHFAFDSSTIDDEARAILEAHAAHLAANPRIKIHLEGHCDERGTREYNLALGERRAQAVERLLRVLGVAGGRVTTVSYGEEKPIAPEHNETAWRLNRRVEIVYK